MLTGKFLARLLNSPGKVTTAASRLPALASLTSVRHCSSNPGPESQGKSSKVRIFPSFTSCDNFSNFVKGPDFTVASSVIIRGTANVPFSNLLRKNSALKNLEDITPDSFTEGALVAVDLVTQNLRAALDPETKEEAVQQLEWQLTPRCFERVVAVLERMEQAAPSNVDLIPQSKDDVVFNWLASTKIHVPTKEVTFLFCTVAMRGFATMGEQVEELKQRRDACTRELQRMKENGTDPDVIKEKIEQFTRELNDAGPKVSAGTLVVSNFTFTIKPEDDSWRIDEVTMRDATQVWNRYSLMRWRMRIFATVTRNTQFIRVLRYDYATDWFFAFAVFNSVLYSLSSA